MKTACAFLAGVFAVLTAFSQTKLPAFGKIDKEDLVMKSCDFDPGASAIKLIDWCEVNYPQGTNLFKMQMERRVRIKILTDKGIEEATVKIPYYSYRGYEKILGLHAVTYNLAPDGSIVTTKLSKDAIFTQEVDKKNSKITFTMPEVKVGSVIEYTYTDEQQSPTRLEDWYFQDKIPTRYSYFKVAIPQYFKFTQQLLAVQPVDRNMETRQETYSNRGSFINYNSLVYSYGMQNVPGLKDEVYMSSSKDYQQRVEFQLSQIDFGDGQPTDFRRSWVQLSKELLEDEDFGLQLKRNIPRTRDLEEKLKNISDSYQKLQIIFYYVRENMTWNGHENIFTNEGVKSAWDKKNGNNGEINLILINLLRDADVPVIPLLVSTRDHGATNKLYPFLGQFNNVVAYVQLGETSYVLNAADKYNPLTLIPYDLIHTDGFLILKSEPKWISLDNDDQRWRNNVTLSANIDENGLMTGDAIVNSYDYSRNPRTRKYKESRKTFEEYFTKDQTALKIENLEVNFIEPDTMPLEQKIKFSYKLNSSGEYKYFNINLFTGLEKNPFISEARITDIDFGYRQYYAITGSIILPDGYVIEEMPKNISMITPDTSIMFRRIMQIEGDVLSYRLVVDFLKHNYQASDYLDFWQFNKKLYEELDEQVVIKRKS